MKKNNTRKESQGRPLLLKQGIRMLWLGCAIFCSLPISAQQKPDFSIQNVTGTSDWHVKLKASGAATDMNCWGSDTYSYTIYKNGSVLSNRSGEITHNQVILVTNGINTNVASWMIVYKTHGSLYNCHYWKNSNTVTASTGPLKPPTDVIATDSSSEDALHSRIRLTWKKGTEVPEDIHHYWIFRDGDFSAPVKAVAGTEALQWIDTDVSPGEKHTYSVVTRVSSSTWGVHVSDTVTVEGSTYPQFRATDGTLSSSIDISWHKMHQAVTSVKILRDGMEIHNRTDMTQTPVFKDPDRMPGVRHTYTLRAFKSSTPYPDFTDTGFARRNGRINGTVKAPLGGPVAGAVVYVERITQVPQQEQNETVYRDTTDANGLFAIGDIYYHEEAEFRVYVVKGDHEFDPPAYEQIALDVQAPTYPTSLTFIDVSSFTVRGRVTQRLRKNVLAVENAEILVNGLYKGTKTDEQGDFSLTVEEIGEYTLSARFLNHSFEPDEITRHIDTDIADLLFQDTEMDTLSGVFSGGCDIYIGQASLRIFNSKNPTGGIDTTIWTNAGSGYYQIILPSREYSIEVVDFIPEDADVVSKDQVLAFFSLTNVDLTSASVERNFVYRKPPEVEIIGFPQPGCDPFNVPIMEQLTKYMLEIRVFESFNAESCLTTSGIVVIQDEISDGYNGPDTVVLEGGIGKYEITAGVPNILDGGTHPYQKRIAFRANVDGQTTDAEQYVLVQGNRPREQTFATVTPEVPFLILRDPPGDQSYSYLSENTKFSSSMSFYMQVSGSMNTWNQAKVGIEQEAGVGVIIPFKLWGEIKSTLEVGASLKSQLDLGLEFAVQNKFSTSGNQNITGSDGDVFLGSAMNMLYALTDVIEYDREACEVLKSQEIIVAPDGFATTFMYTENHIENVLIPQLDEMKDIYEQKGSDSAAFYNNQIEVWRQSLQANADLKENAYFVENRSFSAGVGFESSSTITTRASLSIAYSLYIEKSVALEAGLEVAGAGLSTGAEVKCRMEVGGSASLGLQHEKTVGYYLNDDDTGDFFSVDIKGDNAYGTPVFDLISGRSSCPWETGTQPREGIQLTVDKRAEFDVPSDGQATFKLNLGNTSQSNEDQVYNLVFLQESNPDGAELTIGGSQAQGGIKTPYNVPSGGSVNVTVTVKKGPNATAYPDLKLALLSSCGDGVIGDTVSFSVYFKSNCSAVAIARPFDHWLLNSDDSNKLAITIDKYDKAKLNNVVLQYRNLHSGVWESSLILSSSDLGPSSTALDWDATAVPDGPYEIRMKLACGSDNKEYTFSETVNGVVDREAPAMFGIPQPRDGTYSQGDEISAVFDEDVNCFKLSTANVLCKDKVSGAVYEVGVGCNGNQVLIVPLTEETFTDRVMEITLHNIEDVHGNLAAESFVWEFDIENADFKIEAATDSDGDGIVNSDDNCPYTSNKNQSDANQNGIGDVCDNDLDGDGVSNSLDNCPHTSNADQKDTNEDGIGDVCDDDLDKDGVANKEDNCPSTANPAQDDTDNDGVGDICDVITGLGDEVNESRMMEFYPNPAVRELNLLFEVEEPAYVTVNILDFASRIIQVMMNESLSPGKYRRQFSITNMQSGIYLLQINKNGRVQTKKLLIRQ